MARCSSVSSMRQGLWVGILPAFWGRDVRENTSAERRECIKELQLGTTKGVLDLEDTVYNLGRELKTLRIESPKDGRRWIHRSPAMAAGLTEHIWEIEELLTVLPLPPTNT